MEFNKAVSQHVWHFHCYFDGSGKNEKVMVIFVNELESYLKYVNEHEIPVEDNKSYQINSSCEVTTLESKLVNQIYDALNNGYVYIMENKWIEYRNQKD